MRPLPTRTLIAWLLIFTNGPAAAFAAELTIGQGGDLVRLAFDHQVSHIKNRGPYSLESNPASFDARYYHYGVLGVWSPDSASVNLGRFAVNRLTGDVWDTFIECRKVSFPALRKMQSEYRRLYDLPARRTIPDPDLPPRLC